MIVCGVLFEQIASCCLGVSQVSDLVVNPVYHLLAPDFYNCHLNQVSMQRAKRFLQSQLDSLS